MLIGFALFAGFAFGQRKPEKTKCPEVPAKDFVVKNGDTVYSLATVTKKPEFLGGINAFYAAFAKEFKIPIEKPDLKGRMFISFIIEKDGTLINIKIIRDLGMNTGKEAIRVLKEMPKWIPAQYLGKIVDCSYTLPINIPYKSPALSLKKIAEIQDKQ